MTWEIKNDCGEFNKIIGLLSEKDLIGLGWVVEKCNRISASREEELEAFIGKLNSNPNGKKYHIATECLEGEFFYLVNQNTHVNRVNYLLCDGSQDPDLTLSEEETEKHDVEMDANKTLKVLKKMVENINYDIDQIDSDERYLKVALEVEALESAIKLIEGS